MTDTKAPENPWEKEAEKLDPGQTLPFVAEPPSGVAYDRAVESQKNDSDSKSSRSKK